MSYPYPYKCVTPIPQIEYEEFNGAKFAYVFWPTSPPSPVKARVLIVHGFCEHIQLNHRMMDNLALNGYESFMFDQRGSGMTSPGKLRGLTNETLVFQDLDHFISKNLKDTKSAGIPLFLFGHSMGGGIVLNYACHGTYKNDIAGFTSSAPLITLHPHSQPSWLVLKLSPLLARMLPNLRIDTKLDLEGVSSDAAYRDFLAHDKPLSTPLIGSLRQIYDFLQRGHALLEDRDGYVSNNFSKDKPVLIVHGTADTINDPKASQRFIEAVCPARDKHLELIPDARHSILSLEREEYFRPALDFLVEWLDKRLEITPTQTPPRPHKESSMR